MGGTHPNAKDDDNQWPLQYGHPSSYFDDLLRVAEKDAYAFGGRMGVVCASMAAIGLFAASKLPADTLHAHGLSKRILGPSFDGLRTYHIALGSALSGLLGSQLATHYDFQKANDRILEQRRREAFFRAEARRRGEF